MRVVRRNRQEQHVGVRHEGRGVVEGAHRFAAAVPGDQDAAEGGVRADIGVEQHRPAAAHHHVRDAFPGQVVERILLVRLGDDQQARRLRRLYHGRGAVAGGLDPVRRHIAGGFLELGSQPADMGVDLGAVRFAQPVHHLVVGQGRPHRGCGGRVGQPGVDADQFATEPPGDAGGESHTVCASPVAVDIHRHPMERHGCLLQRTGGQPDYFAARSEALI